MVYMVTKYNAYIYFLYIIKERKFEKNNNGNENISYISTWTAIRASSIILCAVRLKKNIITYNSWTNNNKHKQTKKLQLTRYIHRVRVWADNAKTLYRYKNIVHKTEIFKITTLSIFGISHTTKQNTKRYISLSLSLKKNTFMWAKSNEVSKYDQVLQCIYRSSFSDEFPRNRIHRRNIVRVAEWRRVRHVNTTNVNVTACISSHFERNGRNRNRWHSSRLRGTRRKTTGDNKIVAGSRGR